MAIRSSWRRDDDMLHFDVEIPVNTTAAVRLPTGDPLSVREGERLLSEVAEVRELPVATPGAARFELGSGRYSFTAVAP